MCVVGNHFVQEFEALIKKILQVNKSRVYTKIKIRGSTIHQCIVKNQIFEIKILIFLHYSDPGHGFINGIMGMTIKRKFRVFCVDCITCPKGDLK